MYRLIADNLDMLEVEGYFVDAPANFSGHPDNWTPDETEIEFRFLKPMFIPWEDWDPSKHSIEEADDTYSVYHDGVTYTMGLRFTVVQANQHGFFLSIEVDYDSLEAEVEEEEPDCYDMDPGECFQDRVARDADDHWSRF